MYMDSKEGEIMITCQWCEKKTTTKHFSVGWFILWTLLTGIGGIGYIMYYVSKPNVCMHCGKLLK